MNEKMSRYTHPQITLHTTCRSNRMSEWMHKWVTEWMSEWMKEWKMSEYVQPQPNAHFYSMWQNELSDWMNGWKRGKWWCMNTTRLIVWQSEWMNECKSDWMDERMSVTNFSHLITEWTNASKGELMIWIWLSTITCTSSLKKNMWRNGWLIE